MTGAEQVEKYMADLAHPLKPEMEALRTILKNAHPELSERIKWNAPSYFFKEDIVTFGPPGRKMDEVLLVFHHPFVVEIPSKILTGDYKDRRLAHFKSMAEVESGADELFGIINQIILKIAGPEFSF